MRIRENSSSGRTPNNTSPLFLGGGRIIDAALHRSNESALWSAHTFFLNDMPERAADSVWKRPITLSDGSKVPVGTGIHMIARGQVPAGREAKDIAAAVVAAVNA